MKLIVIATLILSLANAIETTDLIKNETDKEMICVATYPSLYENIIDEDGKTRNVQVHRREEVIQVIQPTQVFQKTREGFLVCYNELAKISLSKANRLDKVDFQINSHRLKTHLSRNNRLDLLKYENKRRIDIEEEFGIAQRCASYKEGAYCNFSFGLDIYFDQNTKVKSIFLYGSTLNNNKLPFEVDSINKLRNNGKPVGLWVQENNRKIFKNKPTVITNSLIMWDNPSNYIKRVIMTAKNGHFKFSHKIKDGNNLFRDGYKDLEKAIDYVNSIEVVYK